MVDIDTTGEETLHQVLTWLANRGVTVALSRANPSTAALLGALSFNGIDWGKPAVPDQSPCHRGLSPGDGASDAGNDSIVKCDRFEINITKLKFTTRRKQNERAKKNKKEFHRAGNSRQRTDRSAERAAHEHAGRRSTMSVSGS